MPPYLAVWILLLAFATSGFAVAPGQLLIAKRDLTDPNFAETVILLTKYGEDGAMGLVLTRPAGLSLARVFPEIEKAKQRRDVILRGGPVQRNAIFGLVRSKQKFSDAERIFADVHLATSRKALEQAFAEDLEAPAFRVYAGYAGWGPGQLDRELDLGAWAVLGATPEFVFDPDPEGLWRKLIRRTELSVAKVWIDQPVSTLYPSVSGITGQNEKGYSTRVPDERNPARGAYRVCASRLPGSHRGRDRRNGGGGQRNGIPLLPFQA